MKRISQILTLFRKELLLEIRQQYTLYGILLYVASTLFVLYLSLGQPEAVTWNGLFWMMQLFICVNAVAKSFLAESRGRMLYYYSIVGSRDFILAKLFFNVLFMAFMSLVSWILFAILLGNPVVHLLPFAALTILGGSGMSLVFTFLSAITARAQQNAGLMVILGFPVMIPQMMLLMKISPAVYSDLFQSGIWIMVWLLVALDLLVIALALILFPFLWKD